MYKETKKKNYYDLSKTINVQRTTLIISSLEINLEKTKSEKKRHLNMRRCNRMGIQGSRTIRHQRLLGKEDLRLRVGL